MGLSITFYHQLEKAIQKRSVATYNDNKVDIIVWEILSKNKKDKSYVLRYYLDGKFLKIRILIMNTLFYDLKNFFHYYF